MGLAASSNGASTGSSSGNSQNGGGDIIRRCHCYSMNYLSLDRRCYRHSLTFNHSSDKTAINPKYVIKMVSELHSNNRKKDSFLHEKLN